jgi:hypothetical protein
VRRRRAGRATARDRNPFLAAGRPENQEAGHQSGRPSPPHKWENRYKSGISKEARERDDRGSASRRPVPYGAMSDAPFEVGTDRTIQLLQSSWLFAECTDDELRPIADKVESRTAAPGDWLVREGEPGEELFVIVDGHVAVTAEGHAIAELGPGDFFGEMSLFGGGERLATVQARNSMQLLVLSRDTFNEVLGEKMATMAPKLLDVVGERLHKLAAETGGLPGWV